MVVLMNPEDVQTVYQNDGKTPFQPAFDLVGYYRKTMRKDLYPESGRFSSSQISVSLSVVPTQ